MQPLASIPSPSQGVWHLGFIPIRAYAIMIIIGIVVAVWLGERRWAAKGGTPGVIIDVAVWAVPFGLVGGRLYHVITDYQRYFGEHGDPERALEIWQGGLGIWGAVVLGAVGAVIGCRRRGISVLALGDAVAPGIALAQAIGRWGNYWNQELYGRPLDAFWAIRIDRDNRPRLPDDGGLAPLDPKYADVATYHPTFLYESLWCIGVAVLVIWADRRFKLTHGRAFALYVAAYTVGRFWIEALRIDEAHHFLGLRLNDWTSIIVFAGAVAYLYLARNRTGPEDVKARFPGAARGDKPAEPVPAGLGPSATEATAAKDTEPATGDAPESTKDSEPSEAPEPSKAPEAPEEAGASQEAEESGEGTSAPELGKKADAKEAETVDDVPAPVADTPENEPEPAGEPAAEPEPAEDTPEKPVPAAETEPAEREAEPETEAEAKPGADEPVPATSADDAAKGDPGDERNHADVQNDGDGTADASGRAGKGEPVTDGK
ncbi:prolipoprotein diacylglyceryl transferase [Actinomadura fibrosa]|uniref:Phosphatidylglycerol--prolipoprotein diacylglyceryl transferase n=1 Tax=Actinomadura fibrosa TaxID=111802 RepID=A0ABW2XNS9_9ACTN|nr:prolipoprotein diacylglyceryl transferase [Actinomadura fibrosa]